MNPHRLASSTALITTPRMPSSAAAIKLTSLPETLLRQYVPLCRRHLFREEEIYFGGQQFGVLK